MSAKEDVGTAAWSPLDPEERAVVWTRDDVVVRESEWAGSYYCAHLYYVSLASARATTSSIRRDASGEPLVGFLHVPADGQAVGHPADAARPAHVRHARTIDVVARAVHGLVDELERAEKGGLRLLLTGFGAFPGIVDNPTGEIARTSDLVVAAVAAAYPGTKRTHPPLPPYVAPRTTVFRENLVLPSGRSLVVASCELPVDDDALHPERAGSIQWVHDRFRPHAHFAMGVHRGGDYRVETYADASGLVFEDGVPRHKDGAAPVEKLPTNASLARAIAKGAARLG